MKPKPTAAEILAKLAAITDRLARILDRLEKREAAAEKK